MTELNSLTPVTFETADMDSPREFAAWAVTCFPDPREGAKGQLVPLPGAPPELSEQLWKLGFRHHADLMTDYPITGNQPGMGWMNEVKFVKKSDYETYWTERATPAAGTGDTKDSKAGDALRQMLSTLDPALAKRIDEMTDEEKAAALPDAEKIAIPAMDRLAALKTAMEQAKQ
jgi:hypothetical protein